MWEESIDVLAHVNEKSHFLNSSINYVLAFLNGLSSVAIIAIGVLGVQEGEITMGAIIAASLLNGRINAPVTQIVSLTVRLERSLLSLNVLNNFMKMPVEKDENKSYLSRPELKGEVLFKNVKFQYEEESISVLNDLNLRINPNEKIAIIGRIGSGKSTLAKLTMNLYEPTDGSVLIDGTSASQIEPADLRKSIGYMPQDNFLFMGTIKDNIVSGTNFIDDEKLIAAAKLAGVDSFTASHEMGFDLEVGERGDGLSGGEKQAIALARAVVHEPNILVLDEPTSQMDNMTEAGIITRLQEFCQNRTLVLITHKFSLLPLVDRIVIVDNGRVVDDGPKSVILNKLQNGQVRVNA
jgi:ATP-binding cassette subfamily C protein LapB